MLSQEIACQDQCCKLVSKPYLNRLCKRRQPMRKAGILFFDPQTHKILLVQSKGNFWGIPKGTSESNETVTECAIREVWEETGLQVDPKQLIHRFDVYNQATYFFITLPETKVKIPDHEDNDANGIGWIKIQCLHDLINRGTIKINHHTRLCVSYFLQKNLSRNKDL